MKKALLTYLFLFSTIIFAQEKTFKTEEISIDPMLNGTLYKPNKSSKKTNLVILIPGSGIPDRNGNQPGASNNSLKFLSEGLASKDIAVFAYDKRAIAQLKAGNISEKDVTFDDVIADVKQVIQYFKTKKEFNKIIISGHSEGSLVGMIASKDNADGYVSIAGAGRPIDEILEEQVVKQAPFLKTELRKNLDILKSGQTFKLENKMLSSLFRESVQPYLISWFKYDPRVEIKKLQIPVLIINGTKDLQVPESDAELLHEAYPKSELVIIENMNHVFKEIKEDSENMKSYNDLTLPVVPELIEKIATFAKKL
ncbi:alpha/beta hydrolase family protein [Flavobacterium qiangtangense]|uniref:Alpha/beta hydrolase family protein n=1 Tax=Flavobacterium qiangtangense TaxID=1442595 RepID=A0ABW1PNZ7_9FLAO